MADFTSLSRKSVLAVKNQSKKTLTQLSGSIAHNAKLQGAVNSASTSASDEASSALTNPYRVHEGEKYDVMEKIRDRVRAHYREFSEDVLGAKISAGLVQLTPKGGFLDATKTLLGVTTVMAALTVKMGQLKSFGWKLLRLSDAYGILTKIFTVSAETAIRFEAPAVMLSGSAIINDGHVVSVHADVAATIAKDEIHRVADAFGLDATYLTALLKATATIHANQGLELASLAEATLSATTDLSLRGGVSAKISTPSLTIADGAGGTISMAGGIINLNPVVPASPETPVVVTPVVTVAATNYIRATETLPQYEGVNGHGTSIV